MASSTATSYDHLFTFPRGDVHIKVTYKGQQLKGKVVVLRKFLSPPWRTAEDDPVTQIDCSGDDGVALLILLRIMHLQLTRTPQTLDLETFYKMALLCEQYDCVEIISPWIKIWLEGLGEKEHDTQFKYAREQKAYIYWAFGKVYRFRALSMEMVKDSCFSKESILDGDGYMSSSTKLDISREILPDRLFESMQAIREATIEKLLGIPYAEIEEYYYSYTHGARVCLHRSMYFDAIDMSVESLAKCLRGLVVLSLPRLVGDKLNHNGCGGDLYQSQVKLVMDSILDPTLDCHIKHMEFRSRSLKSDDGEFSDYPRCVQCSTYHFAVQECPPNPRKRPAE
ncbi:hypothetical protein IFR05_005952 [Cadophora sp. M221]|nr:hypothetical protein IFR05_005952 [Cadophora sp. M221]